MIKFFILIKISSHTMVWISEQLETTMLMIASPVVNGIEETDSNFLKETKKNKLSYFFDNCHENA